MPHLLAAISSHGYGHLAQVAPVLNRLRRRLPELRLTLRTTLPRQRLTERIEGEFALQAVADDFGMLQHDALRVDLEESLARYRTLHENWEGEVARVAAELEAASPDLIFADVPYLTLAAAHRAGIPAVAMCSLNWHAILSGYLGDDPQVTPLLDEMAQAYASAEWFLRPEPSMPMPGLGNQRDIGVVTEPGKPCRTHLEREGFLHRGERLVVVAMGGFDHRLPIERWPQRRGIRYAVPASWGVQRDDCFTIEGSGLSFSDLLASADAVITKPGYGTFTEAVLNGIAVLFVRRGDWPEEPALVGWLQCYGRCAELKPHDVKLGGFVAAMEALWSHPSLPPPPGTGADEVAELLYRRLQGFASS